MAEDTKSEKAMADAEGSQTLYYIVGALVVVAIAVGAYFLRPKSTSETAPTTPTAASEQQPVVATGPISQLACESQYYNPVIGFPKYYVSVQGVDVPSAKKVDCTFTISVSGKTVATESASSNLLAAPERNGGIFRCTTKALELEKKIPTKVDVEVKDDLGTTVGCSRSFSFP